MIDNNYEGEFDCIEFDDGEGNKSYFYEEMVIPHDGKQYAILVSLPADHDHDENCHCQFEPELTIARIDTSDEGDEYVPISDEEFETIADIYEKLDEE